MIRTWRRAAGPSATAGITLLLASASAQAAVNISPEATQNMSCSGGVCTATAQKAYLNVNDVTNMLASGDLKVVSGAGAEDIHIQAPFSWTSTSRLTLDAQRSIEFEKPVSVAGTGALTLITNDGGTGGDYWFDEGASLSFWDINSSLILNGQSFTLVKDIKTLAAKVAKDPNGHYALARNYDASADGRYQAPPIQGFHDGTFDGLGNTISNLTIKVAQHHRFQSFGLFDQLNTATLRDVVLSQIAVDVGVYQGIVGGLVGSLWYGTLAHDYVSGKINAGNYYAIAGGLFGNAGTVFTVTQSRSSAQVSVGGSGVGGGLGGYGNGTNITFSSSDGSVSGGDSAIVGGLMGEGGGTNCFSSATVTVGNDGGAGGLAGFGGGVDSFARGSVSGGDRAIVGGLAGDGGVIRGHASGNVTAGVNSHVGGLIGRETNLVYDSYSEGRATGGAGAHVGGLAGSLLNQKRGDVGTVEFSYSRGSVEGGDTAYVGGLVGYKDILAPIEQAYSTGKVTGGAHASIGGFVGYDAATHHHKNNHIISAYWDLDTSGITDPSQGTGNVPNDPGITGLSDTELKAGLPNGFDPQVWGHRAKLNNGYPYLLANQPPKSAPARQPAKSYAAERHR